MKNEINYGKKKTFDVLNKIQSLIKVNPEGNLLRYKIKNFFSIDNKNSIKEDEILYDLRKWGALEIDNKEHIDNEITYYLKILPKFKDIYTNHENILTEKNKQTKKSKEKKLILYLNEDGDLWYEPKDKYCYKLGEKSNRHKIIRYLTTNKGYQNTADISFKLENKSKQSTRTEIAKLRKNIKKFLNIDGKSILEARKGSGYKIGQKYKIKLIQ